MTDSAGKIFHSNKNYSVRVNADVTGYHVINDNSGVTEFESESLPECIFAAENLNVVLEYATWEWIAKNAVKRSAAEIGIVGGTDMEH
jgi:hypothetical protein